MKAIRINVLKPGGAAETAGARQGDAIISYNGVPTPSEQALHHAISSAPSDAAVRAEIVRDGSAAYILVAPGPLGIIIGEVEIPAPQVAPLDLARPTVAQQDDIARVLITTAPSIDGRAVASTIDIVAAEYVFGINFMGDLFTALRDLAGGRSATVQNAMRDARQAAMHDLRTAAYALGGNAVISTRIDYSEFSGKGTSMVMLAAYGTAVQLAPE